MASSNNRTSTYTQVSTSSDHDRPKSADAKKDIWSSMLDSVASGKRLPEKNLLVLGKLTTTPHATREFLETLSADDTRKTSDRQSSKQPTIANNFALGYTYHDVLDADHEDILARLSLYLLADPSPSFAPLLQPLLTPETIPNTLVVILLDWSQPWFWLRQLRDWVQLLRTLLVSLDNTCKDKMEEVMLSWRDRGRGGNSLDGVGASSTSEGDSDRIENLEKERSWREEEFDFILQFLRTILLKLTSPLQSLIHSSLGIHSLLKRQPLKHNVIDRDKVVVPPNWDSWGKIRVLRDGFDVEAISNGWSVDIEESIELIPSGNINGEATEINSSKRSGGAVEAYEETIRDPRLDALQATSKENEGLIPEITSSDTQTFLATQLAVLDKIRQGTDSSGMDSSRLIAGRNATGSGYETGEEGHADEGRVNEHIGPVQFNMGGIQVDADDMLQRLKDRQSYQTPEPTSPGSIAPGDAKTQNEALQSFFAGLMKRGAGSAASSPKPGGS
ncbi:hypothetical protein LCER1_G000666 [Lachnellula cervina]|uniref:Cytoplasmic dynein 1 light intermediate chain 2 n=1 Tax=Lachnellula cervina TaxID=1316786 RepID=A0A7D8UVV0_9HELO|nr:hypothetical protein LCER1_G000666 [Lachnellula cervina]